jgi:predicted Zn-dependent protease
MSEFAGTLMADAAEAFVGFRDRSKARGKAALQISDSRLVRIFAAEALAAGGETGDAQRIIDSVARESPTDTHLHSLLVPLARAFIAVQRKEYEKALGELETARPYDLGYSATYFNNYLRGQAYMGLKRAAEAEREFQTIVDNPGVSPGYVLRPLAVLGLARARALAGDTATARKHYQDFLALWKDADPDVPILLEAKKEYAALK